MLHRRTFVLVWMNIVYYVIDRDTVKTVKSFQCLDPKSDAQSAGEPRLSLIQYPR